jgi:putative chitinase
MNLTLGQLLAVMPLAGPDAPLFVDVLNVAMRRFAINTPRRVACFLGQLAPESGQLAVMRENLNYTAEQLLRTWPKRFTSLEHAKGFAHMPEQIANFVYANRMGNGDMASGDGWRHRGAGWIQLTGKKNQTAMAEYFGVSSDIGNWLCDPHGAALSAAWFWSTNGCNELADAWDIDGISDTINLGHHTPAEGDAIGYKHRLAFTLTGATIFRALA